MYLHIHQFNGKTSHCCQLRKTDGVITGMDRSVGYMFFFLIIIICCTSKKKINFLNHSLVRFSHITKLFKERLRSTRDLKDRNVFIAAQCVLLKKRQSI